MGEAPPDRVPLDNRGITIVLALTVLWGFNHVALKLATPGIPLVMQMGVRFAIAAALLAIWAEVRGIPLNARDGTLASGLLVGGLFAVEFLFIAVGLNYTSAARMIVFVNLAPCWTVLGLSIFTPSERLDRWQLVGVGLGFVGVAIAFADGFRAGAEPMLWGDSCGLIAGGVWAATTVSIRATRLARATAAKTLWYQLAIAAPFLVLVSLAIGEPLDWKLTPVVIGAVLFHSVLVGFVSLLLWFWLLTKYLASRLAVFTFVSPLVGVAAGAIVLGETVSAGLLWGAL
ncbi:MAG: DMT family transporter, partial [Burkholderiales bacterium]